MRQIEKSELLTLLNQRYADLKLGDGKRYRKPDFTAADPRVQLAVRKHAQAWPSDPFAAVRVQKDILQGYVLPSEVLRDANSLIAAHDAARRAVEPVELPDAA